MKTHHTPPYRFFETPKTREELYTYCKRIGDYLHKNRIPSVIFLDRSVRPAATGLREYWQQTYADQKPPNMYFVNASGFKTEQDITEVDHLKQRLTHLTQEPAAALPSAARTQQHIQQEFEQTYPQLMKDKDQPVLLFDACIHSGNTMKPVKETLRRLGFKDVRIGTIEDPPGSASVSVDFYMRDEDNHPAGRCRPFGSERSVKKTYDRVHSSRVDDPDARREALALRAEIQRIVEEKGKG